MSRGDFNHIAIGIQCVGHCKWIIGDHQLMMDASIKNHRTCVRIVGYRNIDGFASTLVDGDLLEINQLLRDTSDIFRYGIANGNRIDIYIC